MHPANERRRYDVTSSLVGWIQAQNEAWEYMATVLFYERMDFIGLASRDIIQASVDECRQFRLNGKYTVKGECSYERVLHTSHRRC